MAWIKNLEIHLSHACNLTCESCVHFSNAGHKGMLSLADAERWYGWWAPRLQIRQFCLMGGEPLLNRDAVEHIRLAAKYWNRRAKTGLLLVTNGFYVDRHPELFDVLRETNCQIHLSVHHNDPAYLAKIQPAIETIEAWGQQGLRIKVRPSYKKWYRNYRGFGPAMLPFHDNDPQRSWQICHSKDCRQLHDGKIWKCPPVAYLPIHKERYPELSDEWDPYLAYQAIEHTATDQELLSFLNAKAESCCGMCPARYRYFDPASPMISVGQLLKLET